MSRATRKFHSTCERQNEDINNKCTAIRSWHASSCLFFSSHFRSFCFCYRIVFALSLLHESIFVEFIRIRNDSGATNGCGNLKTPTKFGAHCFRFELKYWMTTISVDGDCSAMKWRRYFCCCCACSLSPHRVGDANKSNRKRFRFDNNSGPTPSVQKCEF